MKNFTGSELEGIARGEKKPFERLVREFQPMIYHLLKRLTGSDEDAADLAQEVFIKARTEISSLSNPFAIRSWLCRIAVNMAMNFLKTRGRTSVLEESYPGIINLEDEIDRREKSRLLSRILARLDIYKRAVIVLHDLGGLSVKEIAAVLEIPEGTVLSRLYYARREIRALMKAGGHGGEKNGMQ